MIQFKIFFPDRRQAPTPEPTRPVPATSSTHVHHPTRCVPRYGPSIPPPSTSTPTRDCAGVRRERAQSSHRSSRPIEKRKRRQNAGSRLGRPVIREVDPSSTSDGFTRTVGHVRGVPTHVRSRAGGVRAIPGVPSGEPAFSPCHHLTFPPPSWQMFAQLRNALARNASVFQTARNASSGANGKAWAVDLMASEAGISKKQAEIALKSLLAGIEEPWWLERGSRSRALGPSSPSPGRRAPASTPRTPPRRSRSRPPWPPSSRLVPAFKSAVNK